MFHFISVSKREQLREMSREMNFAKTTQSKQRSCFLTYHIYGQGTFLIGFESLYFQRGKRSKKSNSGRGRVKSNHECADGSDTITRRTRINGVESSLAESVMRHQCRIMWFTDCRGRINNNLLHKSITLRHDQIPCHEFHEFAQIF